MSGIIKTTYDIVTPESAEDGDTAENGWIDEDGAPHSVQSAIALLVGCEPSSSHFYSAAWYTRHAYSEDLRTGAVESRSYHLSGFSDLELRAIWTAVMDTDALRAELRFARRQAVRAARKAGVSLRDARTCADFFMMMPPEQVEAMGLPTDALDALSLYDSAIKGEPTQLEAIEDLAIALAKWLTADRSACIATLENGMRSLTA